MSHAFDAEPDWVFTDAEGEEIEEDEESEGDEEVEVTVAVDPISSATPRTAGRRKFPTSRSSCRQF